MESQERIRLIIAEDQDLVRRGIAIALSYAADMVCLGEARNGDEAVKLAAAANPDIVLMDLHMPVKGGVAATREIRLQNPQVQVLVLTTLSDDDVVFEAILAGAHGYLLKDVGDEELLDSIRALHRRESALTPPLARRILDRFQREAHKAGPFASPAAPDLKAVQLAALSGFESRLLALLADGRSEEQAAVALGCSLGELRSHLSGIMEKLHGNSDVEHAFRAAAERSTRPAGPLSGRYESKR